MTCLTCWKLWTAEDAAADADEIKISATREVEGGGGDGDEIVMEVKEVDHQDTAAAAEDVTEGGEEDEVAEGTTQPEYEAVREVPPTAEELASAIDVEEVSKAKEASTDQGASKEPAPPSGGSGVLSKPREGVLKRVNGDLVEGGLLLTQVMGGRKAIRRLEVESDAAVLKWEVEAVFGMKWEKVKLAEARMMCSSNLVKIGVQGRREFLTFEACDDEEAAAVCDALVGHAKSHKIKDL